MKQMTKADIIKQAILPLLDETSRRMKEMDRYGVYYTHRWEQGNEEAQNVLVVPNDKRFDRLEFIGMWLDMLLDYAHQTGWELKDSLEVRVLANILRKLDKGEKI